MLLLRALSTTRDPFARVLKAFRRLEGDQLLNCLRKVFLSPRSCADSSGGNRCSRRRGGALTSEQPAEVLCISRQTVDQRRAATMEGRVSKVKAAACGWSGQGVL
jgi:hypothetical protein